MVLHGVRQTAHLCCAVCCAAAITSQSACLDKEFECGPARGVVKKVLDGDTVDLTTGERVRYLLVDTPERRGPDGSDCFATQATIANRDLVLGREVALQYDAACTDRYGRLLAYVSLDRIDINARLVERGYACVLYIPPNGTDLHDDMLALEEQARLERRGMWGVCPEVACD